jgi:hypothetical protein
MNLQEFILRSWGQNDKNASNLFKQQLLMHINEVLCKISVVESSYLMVNYKNI